MTVFEELIDELKEEDLLEETVFSLKRSTAPAARSLDGAETSVQHAVVAPVEDVVEFPATPADELEAYRRRAMEEVSSLQMVEHVLSGIEREHMKKMPEAFDDLEVKKALHRYLQVTAPVDSEEHAQADSELYRETEKWFTALSIRDSNISVANVRRFCENSRPALSSQALMSLGRFYRNSPFTEAVRGKFDFVMTKLFSSETENQKRKLLFGPSETLGHIRTLYANWASLSIVDAEEAAEKMARAAKGFQQFAQEAAAAETFQELVDSDFFNRVRLFKEGTAELFFEPAVIAEAMDCNVRIGNRFVDLVRQERFADGEESIEEKYGYSYDTIVSGAASKTLLLLDLLNEARSNTEAIQAAPSPAVGRPNQTVEFERAPVEDSGRSLFAVNKWLALATVIVIALSAGVYFWSDNVESAGRSDIEVATTIHLDGTELKQHIREASTSGETFYGLMQPTWNAMDPEAQKQFLSKTLEFAKTKRLNKVNLLNDRGRTVGFASADRLEVYGPQ